MIADLDSNEALFVETGGIGMAASAEGTAPSIMHEYGRVRIAEAASVPLAAEFAPSALTVPALSSTERLGSDGYAMRNSEEYAEAKEARPFAGMSWGVEGVEKGPSPIHMENSAMEKEATDVSASVSPELAAAGPLSARITGRIAVGLVLVSGTTKKLELSNAEQTKVVAEVQHGLSFLADKAPLRDVTFVHSIEHRTVTAPETTSGTTFEAFEAPWRDEALKHMGYPPGLAGCRAYAEALRGSLGTNWAYVAFVTKYRLAHFAYASLGGPRMVMHYNNDGWGIDNFDRVFAHETGHIFNAPDEYKKSGCNCGGSWGFFGQPNSNCELCATGGGVDCIMRANTWAMCDVTPYHFGYNGLPAPAPVTS